MTGPSVDAIIATMAVVANNVASPWAESLRGASVLTSERDRRLAKRILEAVDEDGVIDRNDLVLFSRRLAAIARRCRRMPNVHYLSSRFDPIIRAVTVAFHAATRQSPMAAA